MAMAAGVAEEARRGGSGSSRRAARCPRRRRIGRCWRRSSRAASFCPSLLFADAGRAARGWPPIPGCGRAKPPDAIAREVRAAAAGAADLGRAAAPPAPGPPLRDAAAGRARARLGDDRRGGARAVGVRRRLPGRGGRVLRRRAAPRARRAARRRRQPGALRRDGDGQAGRRGAELLVGRRRLLLLLDRRGRGGRGRRCTSTTPSCRGACRRRSSSRPATAWCSASICACGPRAATGRSATRWRRPRATTRRSGAPGSGRPGCARGRRRATARWATSCWRCWSRSSIRAASTPRLIDDVRGAARAVPRSGRRGRRARRDAASTSSWARAASATSRWSCRRCSCCTPASGPTCASATRRARSRVWCVAGLLSDREALDAAVGATASGGGSSTACRSRRRADTTGCPATTSARARFARGAGLRRAWRRSTPRWRASARRSRRSPRRWASRRRSCSWRRRACSIRCASARELERLAAAAGFRDAEAAADTLEAVGARLPPALLEQAIASPDPDRALLHFRDLALRGSDGLMRCCATSRSWRACWRRCSAPATGSPDLLVRHPAMWDALVEGLGARVRTRAELRAPAGGRRCRATARRGGGGRGRGGRSCAPCAASRREEMLRIGLHDVAGSSGRREEVAGGLDRSGRGLPATRRSRRRCRR